MLSDIVTNLRTRKFCRCLQAREIQKVQWKTRHSLKHAKRAYFGYQFRITKTAASYATLVSYVKDKRCQTRLIDRVDILLMDEKPRGRKFKTMKKEALENIIARDRMTKCLYLHQP